MSKQKGISKRFRITIMLDKDLRKTLLDLVAEQISETSSAVSFSDVLNQTLKKGLEND